MRALIRNRPRLALSTVAGCVGGLAAPAGWSLVSRLLFAWDCGVLLFLALMLAWMWNVSAAQLRRRYAEEDQSAAMILVIVVFAALLSVVAIVEPLATLKAVAGARRLEHFALATVTLAGSWLLLPTMFTVHYASLYYSADEQRRPLEFPATTAPDLWDFAYFSFTIAAACQTSDVSTTGGSIRRVVLAQTLVSFLFNLAILGFAINVTAGLIG